MARKSERESSSKTVTYENRKGVTYYLGAVATKKGRRYVFSRQLRGAAVPKVPEGYEIAENVHGQVSLRKIQARAISDLEMREVDRALRKHEHTRACKAAVRGKSIVVFEPQVPRFESAHFGLTGPVRQEVGERFTRYEAVVRFNLLDRRARTFEAERMCYKGGMEGWLSLHRQGRIGELAREFVPHIGKDSFFELPWL